MPTPSGHGATHRPPQNRTSSARKRPDGRPIANDQCLFGRDGVALKEIHRTMSPRGSFLLFQKGFIFSSKSFDHKNNITTTSKKRLFKERLNKAIEIITGAENRARIPPPDTRHFKYDSKHGQQNLLIYPSDVMSSNENSTIVN